jgi:hypothetical protein
MLSQICIIHGVNTLDKSKARDVLDDFDYFWLCDLGPASEAAKCGQQLATVETL